MRAFLKNYRQSPRKVRLVANLVRGKEVSRALTSLAFLPKRAALPVRKLILSAVSNAKQGAGRDEKDLVIKNIQVDEGFTFKRIEYRARGSSNVIKKRTSHVLVELGERSMPDAGQLNADNKRPTTNDQQPTTNDERPKVEKKSEKEKNAADKNKVPVGTKEPPVVNRKS